MKPLISRGRRAAALALLAVWILTASAGHAQVPKTIGYQGSLTDASGNPVTGSLSITFRLYNTETGGTALWIEPQTVAVTNGAFNIVLGNVTPLDKSLFAEQLFLGIQVGADTEMIPRQALTSVPHAFRTIAAPAGVNFVTAATSSSVALQTADIIVASVTITAPAAGVVIVNANGWFNLKNSVSNHARCSVTTGGFVQTATAIRTRFPTFTSDLFVPMARTRVFPLAGPGSVTYNLVCDKVVGNIDINDVTMSAIYVPETY